MNIGDDALETSVSEEYMNNTREDLERRKVANQGSFFSRMFDFSYEERAEVDTDFITAYQYVSD